MIGHTGFGRSRGPGLGNKGLHLGHKDIRETGSPGNSRGQRPGDDFNKTGIDLREDYLKSIVKGCKICRLYGCHQGPGA